MMNYNVTDYGNVNWELATILILIAERTPMTPYFIVRIGFKYDAVRYLLL